MRIHERIRGLASLLVVVLALGGAGCGSDERTESDHAETGTEAQTAGAFCEAHQIAEAQCVFCDPSLVESLGFCHGHGVPEAYCYQCNPALVPAFKAVGDWCAGHDRPESQCYICNPELDPARKEDPAGETSEATPHVGEPVPSIGVTQGPESAVGDRAGYTPRTRRPPALVCSKIGLVVQLENPAIIEQAGLKLEPVEVRPVSKTIECNATLAYDADRHAHISAQVPGIVAEVHSDLGRVVEAGEPLVTLHSNHLGAAKSSYLQASAAVALWKKNHARETELLERGVSTEKDVLEAETRLAESRIRLSEKEQALLSLGLSPQQVAEVVRREDTSARYVIKAPFRGTIVGRQATLGEVVDPARVLFEVADREQMWGLLDVYEDELKGVAVGQSVVLQVDGLPGEAFPGEITWVSSELDPRTRTLQVRAEFSNARNLLRANMFARGEIVVRTGEPALVVPAASVQWEGCCNVVFVKTSESSFVPRPVRLGVATGTVYEVLDGVEAGEEVVTEGSFLLKTEILKGSIGAGCCEVDPGA